MIEKVEQINWDLLEPAERGEINWDSLEPAEDSSPGMDPAPSGPEGVNSQDRVLGAWNKATQMTKANVMNTKIVGGMMSVEEFKQVGEAGAYAYGEAFRRPLAALTALAVDVPFADEDKGVMATVVKGFMSPEKYPPQEMTTALIDAGMEPISAAALATLGQFGYYLGMGQTFGKVIQSGKVGLLNKTLENIEKVARAKGVGLGDITVRAPEEVAANHNVLDVADVYLRSRGLKIAGVKQVEGSTELLLKRIGNLNPESFAQAPKLLPPPPGEISNIVMGADGKAITFGLGDEGVPPPVNMDLNIPVSNEEALANLQALDPSKQKVGTHDLIVPAEYVLKRMSLDEYIGSPLRRAIQDTRIEFREKMEFLVKTKQEHLGKLPAEEQEVAKENVWQYRDKGIPKDANPRDVKVAEMFRKETEDILKRINKTNIEAGLPEIEGLENYMYHMVMPEIINDLIKTGEIAEGFKRIIRPGVSTELFLKTAQERKGMPEEFLVKDPYEVMRVMYAIDLKYINLQKALAKVAPYLEGVKTLAKSGEKWDGTVVTYLDEWINHAIKKQPTKTDLRAQASLDSLVNFVFGFVPGKTAPDLSFNQITGLLSSAAQTGALGLRLKVAIRNLGQTSLDWVMYGTKAYAKGLSSYGSEEGMAVLKRSRVWRSRMPIEAQDRNTLSNLMKKGSILYRKADMRNVGVGILTRYHYAKNVLDMDDEKSLDFADTDVAGTQWSYTGEDLPEIYWSATGRSLATFGSWWMNYFNRFLPEVVRKTFNGTDASGRVVGTPERMAGVRLVVLMGVAEVIRRKSKEALGVAIDFTGIVAPMPFGKSPQVQFLTGAAKVAQGLIGKNDRIWSEGWRDISKAGQMFIPYWLSIKETTQLVNGDKSLIDYLLYTRRESTGGTFHEK